MRMSDAIAMYLHEMKAEGRINSAKSERTYYDLLAMHQADVGNRDPRTIGRNDIKQTLRRWDNPNTQATRRATLVSFYDWVMQEGYRKDNPARQTRPPKKRKASIFRLTGPEVLAMMDACETVEERRAVMIGLCAGLRSQELIGLKRMHFDREGVIWVSTDIAKGGRERYVPIIPELQPVVDDILATVAPAHYVLCRSRTNLEGRPPNHKRVRHIYPDKPMGANTLYRTVVRVGDRAGIPRRPSQHGGKTLTGVNPHLLRHAFCDHVTRLVGIEVAQALMGHADIATTQLYRNTTTLEDTIAAVKNVRFRGPSPLPQLPSGAAPATSPEKTKSYPPAGGSDSPEVETVGIEPTLSADRAPRTGGGGTETP